MTTTFSIDMFWVIFRKHKDMSVMFEYRKMHTNLEAKKWTNLGKMWFCLVGLCDLQVSQHLRNWILLLIVLFTQLLIFFFFWVEYGLCKSWEFLECLTIGSQWFYDNWVMMFSISSLFLIGKFTMHHWVRTHCQCFSSFE